MLDLIIEHWRDGVEIFILWIFIYQLYRAFRATRGARILVGLAVTILFLLWLTSRIFASAASVPVTLEQIGDDGGFGAEDDLAEEVGMDVEFEEPEFQDTLATIADAVASKVALLESPTFSDQSGTAKGGPKGDGRGSGFGPGRPGKPRHWEVTFLDGNTAKTYARQLDLLRFQVKEIIDARLQPEEEAELDQEYQRASNASRLQEISQNANQLLDDNDESILTRTGLLGRILQELVQLDPGTENLLLTHQQAVDSLQGLRAELSRYTDQIEVDPHRLSDLEERVTQLQSLKRKYGATIPDIIEFGQESETKLQQLEQRDVELARIYHDLEEIDQWLIERPTPEEAFAEEEAAAGTTS